MKEYLKTIEKKYLHGLLSEKEYHALVWYYKGTGKPYIGFTNILVEMYLNK